MFSLNFLLFSLLTFSVSAQKASQNFNAYVNISSPVRTIPDPARFLSVALDSAMYMSSNLFNLNFTFISPLAKALGPLYFRVGGTHADFAIFDKNSSASVDKGDYLFTFELLDETYNFVQNAGWRLIFDLNDMLRTNETSTGRWNSSNAEIFLNYSSQKGYEMDFELGEEPEFYVNHFNFTLTGAQIAQDFHDLRDLLNSYSLYKNSMIIGPDVGRGSNHYCCDEEKFFLDFLSNGGGNYINALSFHHYYVNGKDTKIQAFLNYTILDYFTGAISDIKKFNFTPIWLGETSSAYNNGAHNLSDTYVAGFLWLDKLGIAALHGVDVVIRQDLFGGFNALLNGGSKPLPDYWLSLIFKKLVGEQVFNVTLDQLDPTTRLYAASIPKKNGTVVYGINIYKGYGNITIDFPQFTNKQATLYLLRGNGDLQSNTSKLNDVVFEWTPHQPGPNFQGVQTTLPLTIPHESQFFIVVNQPINSECPNGWYKETTNPNKCVTLVTETQPMFAAKFDCTIFGNASILSIENAFENSEILKQMTNSNCAQSSIGLVRNESNWSWINGSPSTYTNWKNGYPNSDNTQNCVTFDKSSGTWSNSDCDVSQCYICQQYV